MAEDYTTQESNQFDSLSEVEVKPELLQPSYGSHSPIEMNFVEENVVVKREEFISGPDDEGEGDDNQGIFPDLMEGGDLNSADPFKFGKIAYFIPLTIMISVNIDHAY